MLYCESEIDSMCDYTEFDYTNLKYLNPIQKGNGQNILIKNLADENIIIKTPNIKIEKLVKDRIGDCYMDLNISAGINKKDSQLFLKFIANIEENNELNIYKNSKKWFNNKQISYDTIDEYRKSSYSISSNSDIIFRVKYNKNEYKHLNVGDVVTLQLHIESIRFMKTKFYTEWVIIELNKLELTDFNFCEDSLVMNEYNDLFQKPRSLSSNFDKLEKEQKTRRLEDDALRIKKEQRLEHRRLEEQRLEHRRLEEQRLEEQRLEHMRLEEQRLEEQRLEEQRLEHMRLEEQRLEEQRLEHMRLEHMRLEEQRLEEQRLEHMRLEEQRLEEQRLEEQRLEEQRLEEPRITKLPKNYFKKNRISKKKSKKKLIYGDKIKIWEN